MRYDSYQDLSDCIRRNAWKVPHDVDLIVGVPRSGMIPALMLAELLNKRCADLDGFIEGRTMQCGDRGRMMRRDMTGKVLVVDDTIYKGKELGKVRERLAPLSGQWQFIFAVIYAESAKAHGMADICFEDTSQPGERTFVKEWNALHLYDYQTAASMWDIDGLLCKDPPNDRDKAAYEAYLPEALPMIIPTTRIGALVTFRIERYRAITEAWLRRYGVKYGQLVMFPADTREQRNRIMSPADFKAQQYGAAPWAKMFYESELRQAERIFQATGKPVFCYENGRFYY